MSLDSSMSRSADQTLIMELSADLPPLPQIDLSRECHLSLLCQLGEIELEQLYTQGAFAESRR